MKLININPGATRGMDMEYVYAVLLLTFAVCQNAALFTVHHTPKTWNEARAICADNGGNLLTVATEAEWNTWIGLLNNTGHPNRPTESAYWFGLHGIRSENDVTPSYTWDPCVQANYTAPLVDEVPNDYLCVVMWIQREIFPGTFLDRWFKGRQCNQSYPFVCSQQERDMACIPSCNELVVTTDVTTCNNWCTLGTCTSQYLQQTEQCHIKPTIYTDVPSYTICVLPDISSTPTMCTVNPDVLIPYIDYADPNINITNISCDTATSTTVQSTGTHIAIAATTSISSITSFVSSTIPASASLETVSPTAEAQVTPQSCMCSCQKLRTFLATPEPEVANLTIEEKVEIIVAELTVDKKNTTTSQRRFISIMDDRPTSVGIGAVAAGIIFSVFGVIVIIDISRIWHEVRYILIKIKFILKGYKIGHKDPVAFLAKSSSQFNVLFAAPSYNKKDKSKSLSTEKKVTRTDIEALFHCKTVPKGKMTSLKDTKIPEIVIDSGAGNEPGNNSGKMRSIEVIPMDRLTLFDMTNDDSGELHMDMNKYMSGVMKDWENKTMENNTQFKHEQQADTRPRNGGVNVDKAVSTGLLNMSGTSPSIIRKRENQAKFVAINQGWRYWK